MYDANVRRTTFPCSVEPSCTRLYCGISANDFWLRKFRTEWCSWFILLSVSKHSFEPTTKGTDGKLLSTPYYNAWYCFVISVLFSSCWEQWPGDLHKCMRWRVLNKLKLLLSSLVVTRSVDIVRAYYYSLVFTWDSNTLVYNMRESDRDQDIVDSL